MLRRELVIGEFVFVAAIVTCMMLVHPVGVIATDGLSAYGVRVATIVPFGIGLLAVCRACWVTACELIATGRYREAHAYRAIAVLVVIVLVTPYTMHGAVELVHELAGGSLFFIQLLLGAQAAAARDARRGLRLLFLLQLTGDLLAFHALLNAASDLLIGQLLSQIAFLPVVLFRLKQPPGPHNPVAPATTAVPPSRSRGPGTRLRRDEVNDG